MNFKLALSNGSELGWVIQSEDNKVTIKCLEFEISVKSKTFLDNNKAWLEFETENPIIVRGHKVTIY